MQHPTCSTPMQYRRAIRVRRSDPVRWHFLSDGWRAVPRSIYTLCRQSCSRTMRDHGFGGPMFDSFVTWASANPYLSLWVQGVGMVVAALIALVAASLTFAGASAQAKAARDIAETDRREATRSLA